ncbi:unnamed protein product [Pocillopora meandrina]|uniref:CUB domain-containing protein n=1 Tax=Pocillopora meandrina TaxID=46732 RepID=A0AAU9WTJ2_9CNID|nr:unnamed protein product [Pocillopora meandrina]
MVHHAACNPCASPEVISGTSGLFSSLNFPTETPPGSTCFWNITVPEGFVVKITFHAFSLSPGDTKTDCTSAQGARLRISDVASTEQARDPFELCGQSIPSPVYTSTNSIQVRLKTVALHGVNGFNASYESISTDKLCPAMANLSDASGVITSPYYPRYYPDDQNCMWDIVASNGKHLKLEIEKTTNIQQCNQCNCDYLDVQYGFDSSGNPSEKICKELRETVTYYSLKDRLRVQFHSDNLQKFIFMGFRAVYTQLESNPRICPKAATLFTASNGKFSSPGYPLDVPSGLDEANKRACTWNITVAAGKRVKLNFTHLNFGTCSSQCDQCTHLDIYVWGVSVLNLLRKRRCRTVTTCLWSLNLALVMIVVLVLKYNTQRQMIHLQMWVMHLQLSQQNQQMNKQITLQINHQINHQINQQLNKQKP